MSPRFSSVFLAVPALLLVASTARAQETFGATQPDDDAPAQPSPSPPPGGAGGGVTLTAPASADDYWWRKQGEPPRPVRVPKPLALRLDGGYAPRRLFDLGVSGADVGLGLGVQTTHHSAWWATSRLSLGSTENGLSVWSSRFGAEVEGVFDPVRFGIGASLFVMGVGRAEREETLLSYGIEGRAFGRVDITRNDDYALFVRAGIDAGAEARAGSVFWGPAFGVGVELGVRGKRPDAWNAGAARVPTAM